ncbi:MAG: ribonuclease P protein subunit [Nanoarchaeota archaeon]|nr:ribonuclease P protein subunit [Nanoarchaeota archaeon]
MKLKAIKNLMIGSPIEITESKNKSLIGLKGNVIDETKNTLTINTKKGIKKAIKSQIKW